MPRPHPPSSRHRQAGLAIALLLGALAGAACSSARVATTSTTPAPATLAPPDTAGATTTAGTAPAVPSSPQSSSEGAAVALTSAWSSGDRARAAQVATPDAVATLFAIPYPRDNLQFRSCSNGSPSTCTYRNTASSAGEIYDLVVVQGAKGWYVMTIQHET